MNGSVGMDLAEISRIRKAMENPRFLHRPHWIFSRMTHYDTFTLTKAPP